MPLQAKPSLSSCGFCFPFTLSCRLILVSRINDWIWGTTGNGIPYLHTSLGFQIIFSFCRNGGLEWSLLFLFVHPQLKPSFSFFSLPSLSCLILILSEWVIKPWSTFHVLQKHGYLIWLYFPLLFILIYFSFSFFCHPVYVLQWKGMLKLIHLRFRMWLSIADIMMTINLSYAWTLFQPGSYAWIVQPTLSFFFFFSLS